MDEIKDLNIYNTRMAKSMIDKLFFLDMSVNLDGVLDFGCADGTLLRHVDAFCPGLELVGYDMDQVMVDRAKAQFPSAHFTTDWEDALLAAFPKKWNFQEGKEGNVCLSLSSVIHEVYSYAGATAIDQFWDRVYKSGFEYIAIRDMMLSESADRTTPIRDEMRVRTSRAHESRLRDFEALHGSIANNKNFIHFLLKYQYVENWDREVAENYLPISTTQFFKMMPTDYEVVIYNRYALPYLGYCVKRDFNVEIADDTHVKILLRRKR